MDRVRRTPGLTARVADASRAGETPAPRDLRLSFLPAEAESFTAALASALETGPVATVTVDLAQVDYLDPRALGVLLAAVETARVAGAKILVAGARTTVYKALHVAKLGALLA